MVTRRDGSRVADAALVGAELELGGGAIYVIRIDDVAPDSHGHDRAVDVSVQDAASGCWGKLCAADPYGRTSAIPAPEFWDRDGLFVRGQSGEFSFACTAGARA
jgi:hypothetical protein